MKKTIWESRKKNLLTRSLREPGGPCTKSMEVLESRMEWVKGGTRQSTHISVLMLSLVQYCGIFPHQNLNILHSGKKKYSMNTFGQPFQHIFLKQLKFQYACTLIILKLKNKNTAFNSKIDRLIIWLPYFNMQI